jgi:DNA repair protein RecO (recombination protein O)
LAVEQSDAIVLRVIPWSETSLIAHIYTRDFGKLSVLAKGARRPKSPFEAALDLLSICRVVFIAKGSDALDLLTEAKLTRRFRGGARELLRLYAGYYVAELLERLTDKQDRQPEIFDLAEATLAAISEPDQELAGVVLRWELQMLRLVGHLPSLRRCAHCGQDVADGPWWVFGTLASGVLCASCQVGQRQMIRVPSGAIDEMEQFSNSSWREIDISGLSPQHRSVIRGVVTRYLTVLLDRKLQMHPFLEELGR